MKTSQNFGLLYVLLIICQVVMCNYTDLGPYIMLTMLPAMVLCIPTGISTAVCMVIAFASGLTVDWLSEGLLGLNAAALTAVALVRTGTTLSPSERTVSERYRLHFSHPQPYFLPSTYSLTEPEPGLYGSVWQDSGCRSYVTGCWESSSSTSLLPTTESRRRNEAQQKEQTSHRPVYGCSDTVGKALQHPDRRRQVQACI